LQLYDRALQFRFGKVVTRASQYFVTLGVSVAIVFLYCSRAAQGFAMKASIRNHSRPPAGKEIRTFLHKRARHGPDKRCASGFTYVGLLIVLAIMAAVSAAALQVGVAAHRREAEETLLDVGGEFSRALDSYNRMTAGGQIGAPATLQDLLEDRRFPGVVRHLRKLYYDPITGKQEWGILRSENTNLIIGVYSLSAAHPIKTGNFDSRFRDFAGKSSYREWVFTAYQADTNGAAPGSVNSIDPRSLMTQPTVSPANALPAGAIDPRSLMQ
jgi:type II secretory pathway pseudopilin PulG